MRSNKKINPSTVEEMRVLRKEGFTHKAIGEKLGLSHNSVSYHLNPTQNRVEGIKRRTRNAMEKKKQLTALDRNAYSESLKKLYGDK